MPNFKVNKKQRDKGEDISLYNTIVSLAQWFGPLFSINISKYQFLVFQSKLLLSRRLQTSPKPVANDRLVSPLRCWMEMGPSPLYLLLLGSHVLRVSGRALSSTVLLVFLIWKVFLTACHRCVSNCVFTGVKTSSNLLCYSEKSGTKMQNCHSSFGFKTCFTKYNYSELNLYLISV